MFIFSWAFWVAREPLRGEAKPSFFLFLPFCDFCGPGAGFSFSPETNLFGSTLLHLSGCHSHRSQLGPKKVTERPDFWPVPRCHLQSFSRRPAKTWKTGAAIRNWTLWWLCSARPGGILPETNPEMGHRVLLRGEGGQRGLQCAQARRSAPTHHCQLGLLLRELCRALELIADPNWGIIIVCKKGRAR